MKYTDDTQIEHDIGVQSEEQADIVEEIEGEKEDSCTKRKLSSWSADRTVKRLKFTYESCNVLDTNSGIINANVIENKKNLDFNLLQLHRFSDGNGRLCILICSPTL